MEVAGLVVGAGSLIVSTLKTYETAKKALPFGGKSKSPRLRDLRSVTKLGLSALGLLNLQMRLLGQNLTSEPADLQYEVLECATEQLKASAVVSVVMKERLERAVTALSTRAAQSRRITRDDDDTQLIVESIRDVLDQELLPLNERLTTFLDEMLR